MTDGLPQDIRACFGVLEANHVHAPPDCAREPSFQVHDGSEIWVVERDEQIDVALSRIRPDRSRTKQEGKPNVRLGPQGSP